MTMGPHWVLIWTGCSASFDVGLNAGSGATVAGLPWGRSACRDGEQRVRLVEHPMEEAAMERTHRDYKGKLLLGFLLFNAISAIGGGLAIMTGWIPEQPSWVQHTDFSSLYFPGVILMAIVGGSSLVAALARVKHSAGWQISSILAGVIMLFWIIGEIASIRGFHFLQLIYFVTGAMILWWTPTSSPSAPGSDN